MSAHNIQALIRDTRVAQWREALDIINQLPELMQAAADRAEPWAVVMQFFVVPGLGILSFEGKKGDLTGTPKIVHDHLRNHGLSPGFIRQPQSGNLPDGSPIEGILYRLVANWEKAPEDNRLRQIYEQAVEARGKEITDRIPQLIAEAAAAGNWWLNVHTFFTSPDLLDLGFDGDPANLRGVARLVYRYLTDEKLNPQLFFTEGTGELGGGPWTGRHYYIAAQWYDNTASKQSAWSSEQSLAW